MGTRGTYGVRVNGEDKLTYNHFDSYPDGGLGDWVVGAVKTILAEGTDKYTKLAADMRLVSQDSQATPEDIEKYKQFCDTSVDDGRAENWYVLLRLLQGDLLAQLRAGIMIQDNEFIKDSLWCEYGYIINFDDGVFEAYEGFQEKPHSKGRYVPRGKQKRELERIANTLADTSDKKYYPCALVAKYPLNAIPADWAKCFKN